MSPEIAPAAKGCFASSFDLSLTFVFTRHS